MSSTQRILFVSNGHGEDNHSSYIIQTLQKLDPTLEIMAMSIVGEGNAYRRLKIPLIAPTQSMPSGGFTYMNRWQLLDDIRSGLIGLTWQQIQALRTTAPTCDLIMATGDTIGQSFAYLSGRPFVSFISCLSSLYEGKLNIGPIIGHCLRSPRCLTVFTRDPYTAQDLQQQGFKKAQFGGIPSLDYLNPSGKDLSLNPDTPMIALLPGSRLPEAVRNFRLQLQLVEKIVSIDPSLQFRAALVSGVMAQLGEIASLEGWHEQNGILSKGKAQVISYSDRFSDIIHATQLVIGMAGLAVDQAVALGKPVIQIPGEGPQFTYAFAEAQNRLLGISAQTIGTKPATSEILTQAAKKVIETLNDADYLTQCAKNGRERLGASGASTRIAQFLLKSLNKDQDSCFK